MIAPTDSALKLNAIPKLVVTIAVTLCVLGALVIYTWHDVNAFGPWHAVIIQMAYNTAICIFVMGVALVALITSQYWLMKLCALIIAFISILTLIDLICGVELLGGASFNIHEWFTSNPDRSAVLGALMSPTTAMCLLAISGALTLSSLSKKIFLIPIVFLNLVILTTAFIAILGHGIGLVPAFIWLGIKMAPHTAIALSLFSIASITFFYKNAIFAFNRLNFFNRIATGFGFMAVLVVALGSVAFMQIHTVSAITHQLYENPLQINNASLRIRTEINSINRQLRNIAIQPDATTHTHLLKQLDVVEQRVRQDIDFIRKAEPTFGEDMEVLLGQFETWKSYVIESCELLNKKEFDRFALTTVNEGQDESLAIYNTLEKISLHAQAYITDLNKSASGTEYEAKKLIVIIVLGFLIVGITVASLITRSLTNQLQKIQLTMLAIVREKIAQPIPYLDHEEEIGDIARALEVFQESFSARRELETRLLQVIEAMPNGIVMMDEAGIIEIVNNQAEKIFEYKRNDLLGKSMALLIPKNLEELLSTHRDSFFSEVTRTLVGTQRELYGVRNDGTEIPIEVSLAPVATKDGIKILASVVDITERRNATAALNESRERMELTTRINQIGVWEYIADNGKLIWNDAMFEIYGRNKAFFTSDFQAWRQCIHPDDLDITEKLFNESLTTLAPYSCKFRIIQPDGTVKFLHAKAKVERQRETNFLRMLGTNIDITREELAIAKLQNIESLRSAIVEFSEDAIISKTPLGIITSWNTGAYNMFGYSAEEAIGKPVKELLFPADLIEQEDMLLAQVRAGLVIKNFETVRKCKNGRLINVSISLAPIKNYQGTTIGVSAIKRDITEAVKNTKMLSLRQLELEKSNRELERSNKELETFAYVASHDLKSPLRGIAQLSNWIEEDLESQEYESVVGHTELLRNRIQRMEKLLDDLLVFYRAGKYEGTLMEVDTNHMMQEIFEIQNNKPGLKLKINDPLPTMSTLSTPLELIIRNLFSNAIKHHDKPDGVISVSSRDLDNHYVEFSVCDDGPGIPEKFHSRIFGMFQTLKPRDELEGSGMGLALIKKIVETYGGNVSVKSRDRGTCFSFSWPKIIHRRHEND